MLRMETSIKDILAGVAGNIRAYRLIRNYSQEYLALKLDISQNAYSKIELGHTRVTIERLIRIAQILEVNISALIELTPHDDTFIQPRLNYVS
jgi:transcriptional regulator with XRE-family HTH domain